MKNNERVPFELPIMEVAQPPPFKELLSKAKTPEQIEKALDQIKEYWYSRGLSDMAKMYEKTLTENDSRKI